jgi:hypothetical protein
MNVLDHHSLLDYFLLNYRLWVDILNHYPLLNYRLWVDILNHHSLLLDMSTLWGEELYRLRNEHVALGNHLGCLLDEDGATGSESLRGNNRQQHNHEQNTY